MNVIGSARLKLVYDYIAGFIEKNGYTPSVREIGAGVGLKSPASVVKYLNRLEISGYIRRSADKCRSIELIGSRRAELVEYETVQIPLLKVISNSVPLLDKSNIKEYFSLPRTSTPSGSKYFAVTAPDNSMEDKGILTGDVVFAYACEDIDNGDCVILLKNNGKMVIRDLFLQGQEVLLRSESSSYQDEVVDTCQIVGKVFGAFRVYAISEVDSDEEGQ